VRAEATHGGYSPAAEEFMASVQAGQFIGARSDFVPEPVCEHMRKLQDEVPPMSAAQAEEVLLRELGVASLDTVFEWIDLGSPLGSASIAQVHKAKLRRYQQRPSLLHRFFASPLHTGRILLGTLLLPTVKQGECSLLRVLQQACLL
jgi:ABC1 atypical kinase-like domain